MAHTSSQAAPIIQFIQAIFTREGFTEAILAVSGGVDSAVSLALTVRALGAKHVHVALMPYGALNDKKNNDAEIFCTSLKIP